MNSKLKVSVNKNPTKEGIKVQFVLPETLEGDAKAQATQKLQSKLNQGLEQYNLTVSQDTDVPYSNVIGFLIPIADIKLLIKNTIGGGASEPTPEETPAPEEPMKEMKRMQKLAGMKEAWALKFQNVEKDRTYTATTDFDNFKEGDTITVDTVRNLGQEVVLELSNQNGKKGSIKGDLEEEVEVFN
jgi:hypothetical protein